MAIYSIAGKEIVTKMKNLRSGWLCFASRFMGYFGQ